MKIVYNDKDYNIGSAFVLDGEIVVVSELLPDNKIRIITKEDQTASERERTQKMYDKIYPKKSEKDCCKDGE